MKNKNNDQRLLIIKSGIENKWWIKDGINYLSFYHKIDILIYIQDVIEELVLSDLSISIAFHGSCVQFANSTNCIGIIGATKSGKTTLSMACALTDDYIFISDDTIVYFYNKKSILNFPQLVFLRDTTFLNNSIKDHCICKQYSMVRKEVIYSAYFPCPNRESTITAFISLKRDTKNDINLQKLDCSAAYETLLVNLKSPNNIDNDTHHLIEIANSIPVYVLQYKSTDEAVKRLLHLA